MNTLQKNIYALVIVQGANYILPLVTVPYLAHVLGVYNFGRIAFAQAIAQYFVVLADFGFNLSATRQVSLVRDNSQELSALFSGVMTIKIALMIAGFLSLLILNHTISSFSLNSKLIDIAYLSVVGSVVFPIWLFQGLERMQRITLYTVTSRLVSVISIFLFVRTNRDVDVAVALQAGANVLGGSLALLSVWRIADIRLKFPAAKDLAKIIRDTWPVFVSNAATTLYTSTNIIVVGLMATPAVVGNFAAADKIIRASLNAMSPISQAVYPRIVALVSISRANAINFIHRLLSWQGAATLGLSIGIYVFARPIIEDLLGRQFANSVSVLKCMALMPFFVGVSNVLGIQTMLAFNMKRQFSRIIVGCGVLNVVILIPLVKMYSADGAAVSVLTTEIVVTISMMYALSKTDLLQKIIKGQVCA